MLPARVIVCGVPKTVLSKTIASSPPLEFARAIAWRRSVWLATGVSVGLFTTIVDSRLRFSSAINVGLIRQRCRPATLTRPPRRGPFDWFQLMVPSLSW